MSRPSNSRTVASAALYSAYFSAAMRRVSGSIATEMAVCPSLSRVPESSGSCTSSSRSVAMVSRILRGDESAHWGYERDVPADRTDEVEIDNDAPCYSLCLEGCGCVKELELWDMSQR